MNSFACQHNISALATFNIREDLHVLGAWPNSCPYKAGAFLQRIQPLGVGQQGVTRWCYPRESGGVLVRGGFVLGTCGVALRSGRSR